MKFHRVMFVCIQSLLLGLSAAVAAASPEEAVLALAKSGKSACTLVIISDGKPDSLLKQSADLIANIAKGWSGVALPSTTLNGTDRELPADQSIVFTTLDALKKVAPDLASSHKAFAQAATIDEQGFVCFPITIKKTKQLFVVSQTPAAFTTEPYTSETSASMVIDKIYMSNFTPSFALRKWAAELRTR